MKYLILLIIITFVLLYLIFKNKLKDKDNLIKDKIDYGAKNNEFIKLFKKLNKLDNKLLLNYKNRINDLELTNFNHSYTPKKLLDDRVIIHINLDNEDYKDSIGL